jgi:hypothetical protein
MAGGIGERSRELRSFVMPRTKRMSPNSTGTKLMASARSSLKSKSGQRNAAPAYPFYALCVENEDYEIVLHLGKPYKVIRPRKNDPEYFFRVIDEEGEDYLYPRRWFVPLVLEAKERRRIAAALAVTRE